MPVVLDELSVIGGAAGILLGFVMATWWDVYPDLAFRGFLFAGMTIAGLVLIGFSKPIFAPLLGNWGQLVLTGIFIGLGVALTMIAQVFVLTLGATPYLSNVPADVQPVYLAEAGISETYLYFGLAAFFARIFHPIVGVFIPPGCSYFMHQYIYGAMPILIWAVVASFLVQAIFFMLTNRLSIPFGIHEVVNFL